MVKSESQIDHEILTILENKNFSEKWFSKKTNYKKINDIFKKSSKNKQGKIGFPDLLYFNRKTNLLIIIENKNSIKFHESSNGNDIKKFAVDGIKHYMNFVDEEIKLIGIAFSGDPKEIHLITTFIRINKKIQKIQIYDLVDEIDYYNLFSNFDKESTILQINKSATYLNHLLRLMDSQERPLLLSALTISLFNNEGRIDNNFRDFYKKMSNNELIQEIPNTVERVLKSTNVPSKKVKAILSKIAFIGTDINLKEKEIIKNMLNELSNNILPLLEKNKSYDIIGKFYQEFLRYAGVADVKKGIVLTPKHITDLFMDIIEQETELLPTDTVFDGACGTGGFLVSAMNKLISISNKKKSTIDNIKTSQLYGVEISTLMFTLSISNMLFRGDGKSNIFHEDFFHFKNNQKYDISLLNPPYAGKDNPKNPTKKEIQFIEKALSVTKKKFLVIVPISTFFTENEIRKAILKNHTLDIVINMPKQLFEPSASTHTAIAVFTPNIPHNNKKVYFYDLDDDGFIFSKDRGRRDVLGRWKKIKKDLLKSIKEKEEIPYKAINAKIYSNSKKNQEWIIQDHIDTNFDEMSNMDFEKTIKDYALFKTLEKYNILDKELSELEILELLSEEING